MENDQKPEVEQDETNEETQETHEENTEESQVESNDSDQRVAELEKSIGIMRRELTKLTKQPQAPETEEKKVEPSDDLFDLRLDGFSKQEANQIIAYKKAAGVDIDEAKSFLSTAIEQKREQEKARQNTPAPSRKGKESQTRGYSDIARDPDASLADKQKAFEEKRDQILGRGKESNI